MADKMIKSIKILTLSFDGNYGGMLQSMALQKVISRLHPFSCAIHVLHGLPQLTFSEVKLTLKRLIQVWRKPVRPLVTYSLELLYYVTRRFRHLLKRQGVCFCERRLTQSDGEGAIVLGSDQVWRARYVKSVEPLSYCFLDFASESLRQCSVAYAASFGTEDWEGTPEETEHCGRLLRQFKAVSVREHSGIRMCRELFGVDAVQMPDPTLLLEAVDYECIIRAQWTHRHRRDYVAAYILDQSSDTHAGLRQISASLGDMYVQNMMPLPDGINARDRRPLSVPQWLRYLRDCKYLVTDSFHGCVFAIIYNKPFVCIGNETRGSTRFDSLFQTFHLESRMVTKLADAAQVLLQPIDWELVNRIHEEERKRGTGFLRENLV